VGIFISGESLPTQFGPGCVSKIRFGLEKWNGLVGKWCRLSAAAKENIVPAQASVRVDLKANQQMRSGFPNLASK
jgi:hypothetical protein